MNDNDNQYIGHQIKSLDHAIKRHIQHTMMKNGFDELTFMHGWILGYIVRCNGEPVYQKDIEKEFNVGRSSVTGMLQLMESKGYIVRMQSKTDARLKQILITEKGARSVEIINNDRMAVEQALTANLSKEEIELFLGVINVMKENLKKLST